MLAIQHVDLSTLRREIPAWIACYIDYAQKAYNTISHLFTCTNLDAASPYARRLERNPEIALRLPHRIVASYLYISQEALSRLKPRKVKR